MYQGSPASWERTDQQRACQAYSNSNMRGKMPGMVSLCYTSVWQSTLQNLQSDSD